MKPRILKQTDLKAGTTFFTVTRQMGNGPGIRYGVAQYLVTSKRERLPRPSEVIGYRVAPEVARFIESHTDAWRTFRDAKREAERRQAIYREQTK